MKRIGKLIAAILVMLALTELMPQSSIIESLSKVEAAQKVKLNKTKATLIKGQTLQLKLIGTKKKISWITSKKAVAVVSKKGKVTTKGKGTAIITAKVSGKKYKCKVIVETPKISKASISITAGKTYILRMNGTKQRVKWTSSGKSIATVASNGKVTGKKVGKTIIWAKIGSKKYKCNVKVTPKPVVNVSKIELSNKNISVRVDDSCKLNVKITPQNAVINQKLVWETSNKAVATVANGLVKAKGVGVCEIKVSYGKLSSKCTVTVDKNKRMMMDEAKTEYDEKTAQINEKYDGFINECEKEIRECKRQGYYKGTTSSYKSEKKSLRSEINTLNAQIAALQGASSNADRAKLARLEAELSTKEASLEKLEMLYDNKLTIEANYDNIDFYELSRASALERAEEDYNSIIEAIEALI